MPHYQLLIFDLDGTLLDTSKGIYNSVRYAEKKMMLPLLAEEKLSLFVGPPPSKMYQELYGLGPEKAKEATAYHREYARLYGLYEAIPYEGLETVLQFLKDKQIKLAVATLKSETIAQQMLTYFHLDHYFDAIVGMDFQESRSKADTIKLAMEKTKISSNVCLVGDSQYDLEGAQQANVDFIGVLYGFGFKEEPLHTCWSFITSIQDLKKMY